MIYNCLSYTATFKKIPLVPSLIRIEYKINASPRALLNSKCGPSMELSLRIFDSIIYIILIRVPVTALSIASLLHCFIASLLQQSVKARKSCNNFNDHMSA